jgi:hypothetical protein
VNAGVAAASAGFVAVVEAEILATLRVGPLPVHAIAERSGRSVALVGAVLLLLRHKSAVADGPGSGHVTEWRRLA